MAPPKPVVVVVVRAVVVVVVDSFGPPPGLNGVPHVAVGPKTAPDRRCRGSASLPAHSMLGRRRILAVGGWRSYPPALRAVARGRTLCLLCCCRFKQCLQLLAHSSLLRGRCLRAAAARFWDTRQKSGRASASVLASMFALSLAHWFLSRAGPHAGGVGARPCGWSVAGRCSRRSSFPSRGSSCTGMSCVGRRSQGSASIPSYW
jgi:hypothetical protein